MPRKPIPISILLLLLGAALSIMALGTNTFRRILKQTGNLSWQIRKALKLTPQMTSQQLKQLLVDTLDPDALVEVLGLSTENLVEAFSDLIEEKHDLLVRELVEEDAILDNEEFDN